MLVYTVHEPGQPAEALAERADSIIFVREGFTWWGFIFGPLWLLLNALWFEFFAALILLAAAAGGLSGLGFKQDTASTIANLLLMLIVGFEGNGLIRWRLGRKGYTFLTSVAGNSREECERRFFDLWLPSVAGKNGRPALKPTLGGGPQDGWGEWSGSGVVGTLPGEMA